MQITLNGSPHFLESPVTVAELLEGMASGARRVAVERNGAIVPRSQHASTPLVDGDRLEVVVAVGGG